MPFSMHLKMQVDLVYTSYIELPDFSVRIFMKKILFLILFSSSLLLANNAFDNFIDTQIKIEAKLLDQNLSLDEKVKIKKDQGNNYQQFFLDYATDKDTNLKVQNPNRDEINRLKLRLNSNKYRGNTHAVMRDEVLLKSYALREGIRAAFHEILQHTSSESRTFYNDKVNDIIVKYFSKYEALDKKNFPSSDIDKSSPVLDALHEAVKNHEYLVNVSHTFSAAVVENNELVYRTARFSNSKFFTVINTINKSEYGIKANSYLSFVHLDIAKVILLIALILLIILAQSIITFIINRVLQHYKIKEEDIEYIQSHITKIFNMITSLIIIHLIIVAYLGFDSKSINVSKLFSIVYVILTTILLYRITNTVAYMKMESIKKSKILKNEVINLSIKVINAFIILAAIIAILKIFGVNLTALLSGLGIAGAAVAFAAKDSISNIFGSVSILMGDVFEQGDWIETKDVNGTVVEIGLRASTIRTFDNALISIPNSELANKGVKNWSRRSIGRRIKMTVGVTYQSDFSDIRQAIDDIRAMLKKHPGIANEKTSYQNAYRQAKLVSEEDFKGVKRTTLVYMDEYADSSINILIYCFSRTVDWAEWLEVKEDVMYKIAEIIEKNNLDFAYPTMTLHQAENEEPSEQ